MHLTYRDVVFVAVSAFGVTWGPLLPGEELADVQWNDRWFTYAEVALSVRSPGAYLAAAQVGAALLFLWARVIRSWPRALRVSVVWGPSSLRGFWGVATLNLVGHPMVWWAIRVIESARSVNHLGQAVLLVLGVALSTSLGLALLAAQDACRTPRNVLDIRTNRDKVVCSECGLPQAAPRRFIAARRQTVWWLLLVLCCFLVTALLGRDNAWHSRGTAVGWEVESGITPRVHPARYRVVCDGQVFGLTSNVLIQARCEFAIRENEGGEMLRCDSFDWIGYSHGTLGLKTGCTMLANGVAVDTLSINLVSALVDAAFLLCAVLVGVTGTLYIEHRRRMARIVAGHCSHCAYPVALDSAHGVRSSLKD